VRTVADREVDAGWHGLVWDGANSNGGPVAVGVYFARGQWNGKAVSRKFTLIR
jgi:hypothetical protein